MHLTDRCRFLNCSVRMHVTVLARCHFTGPIKVTITSLGSVYGLTCGEGTDPRGRGFGQCTLK
jgi:hypothetical protein